MNAIAEPVELLESECNGQGWYALSTDDDEEDAPEIDAACSERVLGWTVERICACPAYHREDNA